MMQKKTLHGLLAMVLLGIIPTLTVLASGGWYHGIHIHYTAGAFAHFSDYWLSTGDITAGQSVNQIGSTFWSTVETCAGQFYWPSYYSFNGRIRYNTNRDSYDFFRRRAHGCKSTEVNKMRTYIRFYIQHYPYAGQEYVDIDWATW